MVEHDTFNVGVAGPTPASPTNLEPSARNKNQPYMMFCAMPELARPVGIAAAVAMLFASNLFMTFAWYWHLRLQKPGAPAWPIVAIVFVSWLIALVEYMIAVPANRLGMASGLNVAQLKIIQECVTVCVFVPFMIFFMGETWRWDYLWAFLCMVGAVYFVNRSRM